MLVQKIVDFNTELAKEKALNPCDTKLLKSMSEHFASKKAAELSHDDLHFLRTCYAERWQHVKRSSEDYTLSASSINQQWVNLAKEIVAELNISYLQLLFPDVRNTHDPADGSLLTETKTLTNFYLNDANQLCRKYALYRCMEKNKFLLCSMDRESAQLKVLSIAELDHLKRCKQESGISVQPLNSPSTKEEFASFWDFLTKKSFPHLAASDDMPIGLLPHLIEAIEYYYQLKAKGEKFALFKNVFQLLLQFLNYYPLAQVNCMYGQRVPDTNQYLLDVLIAISTANSFDIDKEISELSTCLFIYDPILRANSQPLAETYTKLVSKAQAKCIDVKRDAYEHCSTLYISLFVTEFKSWSHGQSISCWDKVNIIPSELDGVSKRLQALFNEEKPNFVATYKEIINEYVASKANRNSLFSQCLTLITRNNATATWLDLVEHNRLSELGSYWFEPNLILYALLAYKTNRKDNQKLVDDFLDELIHTYSQDKPSFEKALRVNILFSQFLSSLKEYRRRHLIILLTLTEPDRESEQAKIRFIEHCTLHIQRRITSMDYQPPPEGVARYIGSVDKDSVLDVYAKLNLEHLDSGVRVNIKKYFSDLYHPILSAKRLSEIEEELRITADPIGANT